MRPAAMTSLGAVLSTATRPRIPLSILNVVPECDRIVVENIVTVAFDVSCFLRVAESNIDLNGNSYKIQIPFSAQRATISYRDMQKIMNYNPGRIDDIRLTLGLDGRMIFMIFITNDKTPYDVCEYDVIRIQKRRKLNS